MTYNHIQDRIEIVTLIKEAHSNGSMLVPARQVAGISKRTYADG